MTTKTPTPADTHRPHAGWVGRDPSPAPTHLIRAGVDDETWLSAQIGEGGGGVPSQLIWHTRLALIWLRQID